MRTVSQFTLYANLRKGSKPDFHGAKVRGGYPRRRCLVAEPLTMFFCSRMGFLLLQQGGDDARQMYHDFLEDLRTKYQADKIFDGKVRLICETSRVRFLDADSCSSP